jgi:hypothetical protein
MPNCYFTELAMIGHDATAAGNKGVLSACAPEPTLEVAT